MKRVERQLQCYTGQPLLNHVVRRYVTQCQAVLTIYRIRKTRPTNRCEHKLWLHLCLPFPGRHTRRVVTARIQSLYIVVTVSVIYFVCFQQVCVRNFFYQQFFLTLIVNDVNSRGHSMLPTLPPCFLWHWGRTVVPWRHIINQVSLYVVVILLPRDHDIRLIVQSRIVSNFKQTRIFTPESFLSRPCFVHFIFYFHTFPCAEGKCFISTIHF